MHAIADTQGSSPASPTRCFDFNEALAYIDRKNSQFSTRPEKEELGGSYWKLWLRDESEHSLSLPSWPFGPPLAQNLMQGLYYFIEHLRPSV